MGEEDAIMWQFVWGAGDGSGPSPNGATEREQVVIVSLCSVTLSITTGHSASLPS